MKGIILEGKFDMWLHSLAMVTGKQLLLDYDILSLS